MVDTYNFIIHSKAAFKTAEARLEIMAGAIPGTVEACELKCLTKAVVDYLKKQNPPTNSKPEPPSFKE